MRLRPGGKRAGDEAGISAVEGPAATHELGVGKLQAWLDGLLAPGCAVVTTCVALERGGDGP